MGKKQIVVPKDAGAQEALDMGSATPEEVIEVTLARSDFQLLWDSGVFAAINDVATSMIDDYEDERIQDPMALLAVTEAVRGMRRQSEGRLDELLGVLLHLFEEAVRLKTEVHFFF